MNHSHSHSHGHSHGHSHSPKKKIPSKPYTKTQKILIAIGIIVLILILYIYTKPPMSNIYISSELRDLYKCSNTSKVKHVEHISWEPRIIRYKNFLTDIEADYLIRKASEDLKPSSVISNNSQAISNERTSRGSYLTDDDLIIRKIDLKIAKRLQVEPVHYEPFYVLNYKTGEEYKEHYDYFTNEIKRELLVDVAGQRRSTFIIYLNDVEEGGETYFPNRNAKSGPITITPKKGDALLFHNVHPNATFDKNSLHAGLPVKKGEKWIATRWIRERPYPANVYFDDWIKEDAKRQEYVKAAMKIFHLHYEPDRENHVHIEDVVG
eukprot:TRINITY_DN2157_c1_g1_i2.p1 TRINITY_DN2157_c1_g1~~TRINITY_DN2157_c1_g1_i2.p1  ORF type:complete len:322 (-),score=79.21 TRINITY_DN2157_c1_g1_i2:106-1071(-)